MTKPTFAIRPYREADEAAVIDLWNVVFPSPTWWNDPSTIIAEADRIGRWVWHRLLEIYPNAPFPTRVAPPL